MLPKPTERLSTVLRKSLTSESFFEKTALLMLTAVISGLLIPSVVGSIQASRSRSDAILHAQSKLYDELANTMLRYETLALDVSWFKSKEAYSQEMHEQAFQRYSQQSVELVSQWRVQVAKAQTLVSPELSDKIDRFLLRVFEEQDTPINALHRNNASEAQWMAQHQSSIQMLTDTNALIANIARDLHLAKGNLRDP